MRKKVTLTILLVSLVANIMASCASGDPNVSEQTSAEESTTAENVPEKITYPYETKDYGGRKFTFLNCVDDHWQGTNHIIDFEEENGSSLNDAIWKRARDTEEKLNIDIDVVKYPFWELHKEYSRMVLAGEYSYDAAYLPLSGNGVTELLGTYSLNLCDIDTLHLDEGWWYDKFIDNAAIDGSLYSTIDYVNECGFSWINILYFNKNLLTDVGAEMPYQAVREGKWTFDLMNEYMKKVVTLNGDDAFEPPSLSGDCVYGFAIQHTGGTLAMLNGCGEFMVSRQASGDFGFDNSLEKFGDTYDKLKSILTSDGITIMKNDADLSGMLMFQAGRALFMQNCLGVSMGEKMRAVDIEYGLLPIPKLDESQKDYYTCVSEYTLSMSIPKTAEDPEYSGAVIDYMAFLGKYDIMPVMYSELCYKGIRDDDSIEMFELFADTLTVDVAYMYSWTRSLYDRFKDDVVYGTGEFASTIDSQRSTVNDLIEQTLTAMRNGLV